MISEVTLGGCRPQERRVQRNAGCRTADSDFSGETKKRLQSGLGRNSWQEKGGRRGSVAVAPSGITLKTAQGPHSAREEGCVPALVCLCCPCLPADRGRGYQLLIHDSAARAGCRSVTWGQAWLDLSARHALLVAQRPFVGYRTLVAKTNPSRCSGGKNHGAPRLHCSHGCFCTLVGFECDCCVV